MPTMAIGDLFPTGKAQRFSLLSHVMPKPRAGHAHLVDLMAPLAQGKADRACTTGDACACVSRLAISLDARTRYRRRNRRSLLAYRMLAVAVSGLRIEAPKMTNYPTMTAIVAH
jgi:hypothetical protein